MPREIRLLNRPHALPQPSDFGLVRAPDPQTADGDVVVGNLWMSVDPYMRGRMRDAQSYADPWPLNHVCDGRAVGRVLDSRHPDFAAGDLVRSGLGWREIFAAPGAALEKLDAAYPHPQHYLSALGGTGLTAYVGLLDLCDPQPGQTVFVSGAAGAVGSIAGQLARIRGCRVIGSAGSDAKVALLTNDFRFDAAFNYKTQDPMDALAAIAPDGIDIYFDNVGGRHLEAAIESLNDFGRIAACGSISRYNDATPAAGPANLFQIVPKRLTMRGFIVSDHRDRQPQFETDMKAWIASGEMQVKETVVDGIENAVPAFIGLFSGQNTGKMLVRLA
ncbi:MAG: hypothetical protein DK306_001654 [Chloroflexi bacterium]|nr:MAG: hypothetical protein DK306_001654 [Chloroflexota bacterium]